MTTSYFPGFFFALWAHTICSKPTSARPSFLGLSIFLLRYTFGRAVSDFYNVLEILRFYTTYLLSYPTVLLLVADALFQLTLFLLSFFPTILPLLFFRLLLGIVINVYLDLVFCLRVPARDCAHSGRGGRWRRVCQDVGAHRCLRAVWCARREVFCSRCYDLRIIYIFGFEPLVDYPLHLEIPLGVNYLFVALKLIYVNNYFVYLIENLQVIWNPTLMLLRKDMLYVIFKLLSADGTNHMVSSWLWFLDTLWMLLFLGLLSFHIQNIVIVFLVQKLSILLSEFTLFLKLKNWGSEWSVDIKSWQVIFSNVDFCAERWFHLLLLLWSVLLEVVTLMSVRLVIGRGPRTRHMSSKGSWLEARNTICAHPCL